MDITNPLIQELFNKALTKSLDSYDVIGFDVDHCLVQYNALCLHKMTYHGLVDTLVKDRNYPVSMHDLTEDQINFPLNTAVCDFKKGCLVKLDKDNKILRAYRGFRRLSHDEVIKLYGSKGQMENFRKEENTTNDYALFITYFDTPFALLYTMMQDLAVISVTITNRKES